MFGRIRRWPVNGKLVHYVMELTLDELLIMYQRNQVRGALQGSSMHG